MNHGRILINALRVPIIGFFYLLTYNAKLGSFMTLWIWFLVAVITFPTQIGPYHQRFVVYAFFLVWVAWLGITDIILCLLLLVSPVFPDFVQNTSSLLAYSVWRFIQYFFEGPNGARIEVSGDKLWEGESAVVIANHVSWTDFYLIHHLAIEAGMLGRCRWFAKKELKYVPFLGAACWAMGFPMLSRKWMRDQAEIDRAFHDIVERGWPTCTFLLFFASPSFRTLSKLGN